MTTFVAKKERKKTKDKYLFTQRELYFIKVFLFYFCYCFDILISAFLLKRIYSEIIWFIKKKKSTILKLYAYIYNHNVFICDYFNLLILLHSMRSICHDQFMQQVYKTRKPFLFPSAFSFRLYAQYRIMIAIYYRHQQYESRKFFLWIFNRWRYNELLEISEIFHF